MKKIILIVCAVVLLSQGQLFFISPVFADSHQDEINRRVDDLLPIETGNGVRGGEAIPLPTDNLKTGIVPKLIRITLQLTGTLAFGLFIYAGVMLVTAQGNEEQVTKFKKMLVWSLVATAFIAGAYALINGILQLVFT